jgi:hypothetical protein
MKIDLSMDARVLITGFFTNGPRSSLVVGGRYAEARLTARAANALNELIANGCVKAEPYNLTGRMTYTGTDLIGQVAPLLLKRMEQYGAWSPTEPNAERDQ